MQVVIARRRYTRAARARAERTLWVADYRMGLCDAFALATVLWIRRRAFRLIRWTQNMESRALARAEVI